MPPIARWSPAMRPEALATDVRIEFVGASEAPSFAAMASDFAGERTFTYTAFQIVAPGGDIVIDGAVDQDTVTEMSGGEGRFLAESYARVLDAMTRASRVLITHEHIDHVMAVARHPAPTAIAPRLHLARSSSRAFPNTRAIVSSRRR